MPAPRVPLPIRFAAKVAETETCWLWTGAINGHGYGHIKVDGRMVYAHRVAYEMSAGPIPAGLDLDHLCRNRRCVNPEHLEPVDRATNTMRGEGVTAKHSRQTHCKRGHPFDEANTYTFRTGRICRACRRARDAERRSP